MHIYIYIYIYIYIHREREGIEYIESERENMLRRMQWYVRRPKTVRMKLGTPFAADQ